MRSLTIQVSQCYNKEHIEEKRISKKCSNTNPEPIVIGKETSGLEKDLSNRWCINSGVVIGLQ